MDPKTFGEAPAAMYLVELLTTRNDQALTRKVSKVLTASRETLRELSDAHLKYDVLSTRTLSRLLTMLSEFHQTKATTHIAVIDPFIANIVVNVLEGGVKTWKRRVQEARRAQPQAARNTPQGQSVEYVMANPLPGEKNAHILQERSKRYLERKGKKDTLY